MQVLQLLHGTGWRGCEDNDTICTGLHWLGVSRVSSLLHTNKLWMHVRT